MPTKYTERLRLPQEGFSDIQFTTANGLAIANGYERVVFTSKNPLIEFNEGQLVWKNLILPEALKWRETHPAAKYVEYRSRDYCGVRIYKQKLEGEEVRVGYFYVSPFDLTSDKFPVLIDPLRRQRSA